MPRKFKTEPPPLDLLKENIGTRISRLRKSLGMTQEDLSKKIEQLSPMKLKVLLRMIDGYLKENDL